ncbi:hypothetical protein AB0M11_06990 [Streptomyces sp. NPDC051987]|uniref:hypothetical protein n=1 Tax=Streptomyces sp. NPDC051987 TaxID=3155808 RepID=UPI0034227591
MRKAALPGAGLLIALIALVTCTTLLAAQESRAEPTRSALRCYAAHRSPHDVVCYRDSWKAEYRHGAVVYVPVLIQVPTPAHPPAVTLVNTLDDVHPTEPSP